MNRDQLQAFSKTELASRAREIDLPGWRSLTKVGLIDALLHHEHKARRRAAAAARRVRAEQPSAPAQATTPLVATERTSAATAPSRSTPKVIAPVQRAAARNTSGSAEER